MRHTDLTQGSEQKHLVQLALPMMVGIFAVFGFNLVDTFFIAKLGEIPLAAISYTFPIVSAIASIALGLGLGLSTLVAQSIGSGENQRAGELATSGVLLALGIVSIFSVGGMLTIEPLFLALGAEKNTLLYIQDYMSIWYFNMIFVVIPMVGNGIIRGTGDTKFPAVVMIFAGLINLVLDPILIFGWGGVPAMGIQGAALATVASRALTLLLSLYYLCIQKKLLSSPFKIGKKMGGYFREILARGIPVALNNLILPLALSLSTYLVSQYGELAVAGYGLGTRIESVMLIFMGATGSALAPFIGQNWGSQHLTRIQRILTHAKRWIVIYTLVLFGLFITLDDILLPYISGDLQIIHITKLYLTFTLLTYMFEGQFIVFSVAFTARGLPQRALKLMCIRMFGLYLPLALWGTHYFGIAGLFGAIATSNVVSGLFAEWAWKNDFRQLKQLSSL